LESGLRYIGRNLHYLLPWEWKAGVIAVYRRSFKNGVMLRKNELGMCSLNPIQKVDLIVHLVNPKTILDVGCGTGKTTVYLHKRGFEVLGIEASHLAIRHSERPDLIRQHDLRQALDLKRYFDLIWCFEVAEHIHPKYVDTFLDSLVHHSGVIALSAAPPGQGGEGHFNEQPKSYWVEKFAERGYELHDEWTEAMCNTKEFYSENMMVFTGHSPAHRAPVRRPNSSSS
jgi:cyclopropane fatty-acyl-phospholipid synthase-like methyltransferase